jgi:hypothetical protein
VGYVLRNGQMVREVSIDLGPSEVTIAVEVDAFLCPYCDKVYKTEAGLEKHIADKH